MALFQLKNTCSVYSLEAPHQGTSIALDKMHFSIHNYWYLFYFSTKTYVVGTHQKRIVEALLMSTQSMFSCRNKKNIYLIPTLLDLWLLISTHNICFCGEIRKKIFTWYPFLSRPMASNKNPQHMFLWRHKKIIICMPLQSGAMPTVSKFSYLAPIENPM